MINLLAGIKSAFTTSASLSSTFANGLEVSAARDAEALPLAILTPVSDPSEYTTGLSPTAIDNCRVQITFYQSQTAGGGTFCLTAANNFDAVFHHKTFSIGPELLLRGERKNLRGPYKDDEQVWRVDLDYLFRVRR